MHAHQMQLYVAPPPREHIRPEGTLSVQDAAADEHDVPGMVVVVVVVVGGGVSSPPHLRLTHTCCLTCYESQWDNGSSLRCRTWTTQPPLPQHHDVRIASLSVLSDPTVITTADEVCASISVLEEV